ncbi:uncharacterized protein LOC102307223 [Haplochromis burtoni]|uniref:uncharacterized protein LOC102307223 n=1 Tax=Haplochromis burtoni TaxID=8153 RepID=UPI0003BD867E|nr:uncharacterized protein LOC102307223 [Haplochromis burtoni]
MATTANEVAKLCPCGKKISAWDTHPVCAACLGLSHAQAALTPAQDCIHRKLLRRRLARQANLSGGDPLLCEAAAAQGEIEVPDDLAATPGASWVEADIQPIATAFPSLEAHGDREFFPDVGVTWGGDANEDGDESADSELLLSDNEEEDSTSLASISWAAKPSATGEVEKPTPPSPLDLDMQDMCKRAAARLNIPWPAVQTEIVKSRFDGKKLPKAKKTGKHVLPVFPELLDEIAVTWKAKPYSEKHPIVGSSLLDCEGMESIGLCQMPQVEPLVASHLHPKMSLSSSAPSPPSKADRFQSSLTDKCYKAAALSVRAHNASSMLMAYQAELEEDMTTKPDTTVWKEICVITDHVLRLHKVAIQATGRAMGLMVLQERARWLGLTNLTTKEKEELLDTPVVPQGLFGAAVTSMQKRCEEKKRDDEALKLCLLRRAQHATPAAPRQSFAQAASRPVPAFRIPKVPKTQAAPQAAGAHKNPWTRKQSPQARPQAAPPPLPAAEIVRRKKRPA